MKINFKLDFSDEEIKTFLTENGYKLEEFNPNGTINSIASKSFRSVGLRRNKRKIILATRGDSEKSYEDEYKKVFQKYMLAKLKRLLLK